jgi:hypothetical protein
MLQRLRSSGASENETKALELYTSLPRVHHLKQKMVEMCPVT